ncbi:hypothetical protein [Pedobacter sp. CG_S7]|uniref:hypothetical protein n=1 Tax=Pedobacter sp. CG_S7 TaxID=3143930 RepID=UPI0033959126
MAITDQNMNYLAVSDLWISYFNLENKPLLGYSHYTIFPDLEERWKQIFNLFLQGQKLEIEEEKQKKADGTSKAKHNLTRHLSIP